VDSDEDRGSTPLASIILCNFHSNCVTDNATDHTSKDVRRCRKSLDGPMKESIQRAFGYLHGSKGTMGISQAFDTTDFHIEAIDLLTNRVACASGVGLVVAIYSALRKHAVQPGLLILGLFVHRGHDYASDSLPFGFREQARFHRCCPA
jgi:predicted ATP-dependent Lon-type protease